MTTPLGKALMLVIGVSMLAGCQPMDRLPKAKQAGRGTTQVYAVPEAQAWQIAKTVFLWSGTQPLQEHRDEGYMLTRNGFDFVTAGAVMGAWVEAVDAEQTKVTVITRRRVVLSPATTLRERTFHRRFAHAVEILQAGKILPPTEPKPDQLPAN